ncbi:MAG: hypothetical protein WAV93_11515 [Bacteroidales bacterium]
MTTDSDFARLDFEINDVQRERRVDNTPRERRSEDREVIELVREMFVVVRQMRQELAARILTEDHIVAQAFPNGNIHDHSAWHSATTQKEKAKAAFWDDMAKSVAKWGLLGTLGFLAVAAWEHFRVAIR